MLLFPPVFDLRWSDTQFNTATKMLLQILNSAYCTFKTSELVVLYVYGTCALCVTASSKPAHKSVDYLEQTSL